mgnify:CR=1 FL=1|tara:strand:- start:87 stop:1094 length:1008 start_codon:yes stop_codon:yes gene_type:complete
MARHGQNPMRWVKEINSHSDIAICTITHIPFLDGYYEESLDILKLCLESLLNNTQSSFDLYVFDNGSCKEVIDYLKELYDNHQINYLILSNDNIGKVGAWNNLFGAAQGKYICYMDSDVYFNDGWLEETLEIFKSFSKAGMVTAQPARRHLPKYCNSTIDGARKDVNIEIKEGDLLPNSYINACAYGLGRTPDEYFKIIEGENDILLTLGDKKAFVSADHFQFVIKNDLIKSLLPLENIIPLGPEAVYQLDEQVDRKKAWRLSTTKYLVHHIGNKLPKGEEEKSIIFNDFIMDETLNNKILKKKSGVKSRMFRVLLKKINTWSYHLLYKKRDVDN